MTLTVSEQAALSRLASFYNGGDYSASNPGGFSNDGHELNFAPALQDVSAATTAAAREAQAAAVSASSALASSGEASAALAAVQAAPALNLSSAVGTLPLTKGGTGASYASAAALLAGVGAVSKGGDFGLGDMTWGTAAQLSLPSIGAPRIQVGGANAAAAAMLIAKYGSNSSRPMLLSYRSAGTSPTVFGQVTSGAIFGIESYVDGGAGPVRGSGIYPTISGTATATYVPTHIAFFNTDAAGNYLEQMRIKADGGLQAGATLADIVTADRHFVVRIYTRATLPTPASSNAGLARVSNPEAGKTILVYCNGTTWLYLDNTNVTIA